MNDQNIRHPNLVQWLLTAYPSYLFNTLSIYYCPLAVYTTAGRTILLHACGKIDTVDKTSATMESGAKWGMEA